MRIKDYTDMVRHLTDSFNIPEARRIIAENPALTQEQFTANRLKWMEEPTEQAPWDKPETPWSEEPKEPYPWEAKEGGVSQLVQPGPGRPGYAGIGGAGRRFSPSSSKFHKMEDGTWKYITDKNEHITGEKKSDVIKKMEKRRQDYLKKLEVQKKATAKKMAKVKTIYEYAGKHLAKVTAGPARNVFYKYAPVTGATKEYSKIKYFKNKTDAEGWTNKAVKSTERITDADFRKLRIEPQYISMDNSDFAKVLNKKAHVNYRGTKWDGDSVGRLTRKLDIPGTGAWSKTLTKKEVLDTLGSTEDGTAKIKAWKKAGSTEEGFKKLYSRASSMRTYRQATAAGYFKTEKFLKKRKSTYEAWAASGKAKIYRLKDMERRGIFPRGDPELDLWRDLYESSQTQEPKKRLTLNTKKPAPVLTKHGNKIIPWHTDDNFKKVKFLDNETGKIITFNNLKKYLGEEKYDKVLQPYKDKYFIKDTEIMYKGQKRKVATLINEGVFGPLKDLPKEGYFHVHHPAGKGKDPFFTQLASWDANKAEWRPRTQLISKIKGAKDFGAKRKVVEEFMENIPEGIQTQPGKKIYGKDPPLSEKLRVAGKEANLLRSKNFRYTVAQLGCGGRLASQGGGDVDCFALGKEKIKIGNIKTPGEKANFRKLSKIAGGVKKLGAWLFGPIEMGTLPLWLAGEGLYAQYANKRDLKKALDRDKRIPQYQKNLLLEGYRQEAVDLGGVGLEDYALDQPNISGALEKIGYEDKTELMQDAGATIADIRAMEAEEEAARYEKFYPRAQRERFDRYQPMFAEGGIVGLLKK